MKANYLNLLIKGHKGLLTGLNKMPYPSIFFFLFFHFSAAPIAHAGSQARGEIGAVAAGLHQNLSNTGSEPHPPPTPQLTATPDP